MSYLKHYKNRMSFSGTDIRDALKRNSEMILRSGFKDSLGYRKAIINDTGEIDIFVKKEASMSIIKAHYLTGTAITPGDVLSFDNEDWIIYDYYDDGISPVSNIYRCNHRLKFIKDGVVYETPCVITNASKYTLGINENISHSVKLGDGRFSIIMPNNKKTMKIKREDRFIFNESSYSVYDKDITSQKGIMTILTGEAQILTQWDNRELEIADYYKVFTKDEKSVSVGDMTLTSSQGFDIRKFNTSTFTTTIDCEFRIDYLNSKKDDITVNIIDKKTIKIKNNKCENGEIKIICIDEDGNTLEELVRLVR